MEMGSPMLIRGKATGHKYGTMKFNVFEIPRGASENGHLAFVYLDFPL